MIEHPEVDVVTVGAGWTAGIAAQQLTAQGLDVVSLEKGRAQWTWPDFAHNHDELRFTHRGEMLHEIERETWTWRPNDRLPSLPMRQYGSFHPGSNLGGAGVHWSAVTWRFLPTDFDYVSHHTDRYGANAFPEGHSNQDWPVSYTDLEPHYTQFEIDTGMSGRTGNLNGEILEGGNPFEGPRSRPYPLPPLAATRAGTRFAEAAEQLGYTPFRQPSSILSEGYTDMTGEPRAGCVYCGFCTRYGCHVDAKASALTAHIPMALDTGRYEIRTRCYVKHIAVDNTGLATGLVYLGADGREHFQPARTVLLSGYTLSNVRLLLLSRSDAHPDGLGNARQQVGRNYTYQIWQAPTIGLFEGERFNTYMGNTSTSHAIYDFAGDAFDHAGLGFLGGGQLFADAGERLPIGNAEGIPAAQGEAAANGNGEPREWGAAFKQRMRHWDSFIPITMQAESPAYEFNRLDLDPNYTDFLGRPLLRLTFDFTENEARMYAYIAQRASEIMDVMNPSQRTDNPDIQPYRIDDYQSTHNQGGAIMGTDPSNSVTNRYGQVWDAPNVFVTGAALFPQNPGANPTATVNALMYYTLAAMRDQNYFQRPGELLA
ncbi:GMC family oxidoreductase [Egicoccus halophilus]|uniref:GMC family oxidoreductase n=1 Tax=Egicoccus halophilus TaxID=1670830 RepID=A0A8J3ESJ9_9ACTN|nr:GMC family oxidoreductase [Egicoccus halophilus]GGI03036.1 GMC family oxidoreductase [Egicoccus halophilus]